MNEIKYDLPNGKAVVFCYDDNGVGRVTLEAMDALMEMIKELPSTRQWIICSKRLPFLFPIAEYGESKSVLACLEDGTMNVLYFDGGNWCYPTGEPYIGINHENGWHNRVVAWMPLPEPYKEKNDE